MNLGMELKPESFPSSINAFNDEDVLVQLIFHWCHHIHHFYNLMFTFYFGFTFHTIALSYDDHTNSPKKKDKFTLLTKIPYRIITLQN